MLEKLFKDFIKESDVKQELCNKYEAILPNELIELWKRYGFGSFMQGYLKVINPEEYQDLLINTYFRGNISVPIFITAFGDIITWEENKYIRIVKYKNGIFKGMASGFKFFFEDILNEVFNEEYFDILIYTKAVQTWGDIKYEECFGFVPLLGLGGNENVQNLKKVKIKEHIEIISQLVGGIGMC